MQTRLQADELMRYPSSACIDIWVLELWPVLIHISRGISELQWLSRRTLSETCALHAGPKVKRLPDSNLRQVQVVLGHIGGCLLGYKLLEGLAIVGNAAMHLRTSGALL